MLKFLQLSEFFLDFKARSWGSRIKLRLHECWFSDYLI
jgi:hypothetical protein